MDEEDTTSFTSMTGNEFGIYREIQSEGFRFTAKNEFFYGNFGKYFPNTGFY